MKDVKFTIKDNYRIAENPATGDIYKMTLLGDTSDITAPGQFVNIRIPERYLRRPISVNNVEGDTLTLLYKVIGSGTNDLSQMKPGVNLDVLSGLGNGFDVSVCGDRPVLVGGGIGTAPLYLLARELMKKSDVTVILGFKSQSEVIYKNEFEALGCRVLIATEDGSCGIKGFVTNALGEVPDYTSVYTCGPYPMFKALHKVVKRDVPAQFSMEERMGCGFGACMGCSIQTNIGFKRVCKDGPVFNMNDLMWDD